MTNVSALTPLVGVCAYMLRNDVELGTTTVDQAVAGLVTAADQTAIALEELDSVAVRLTPGNGYVYDIVLALVEPTAGFPGDLLVALTEWNRCMLLSTGPGNIHVTGYVREKLQLPRQHCAVVAAFTTLLDNSLQR